MNASMTWERCRGYVRQFMWGGTDEVKDAVASTMFQLQCGVMHAAAVHADVPERCQCSPCLRSRGEYPR